MKKLYLATVCFLPIAMIPLFYAVYLRHVPFPDVGFQVLEAYFFIGFLFLLVDLWRSRKAARAKALWSALNLTVGLIALPIYWFVVICHPKPTPMPPLPSHLVPATRTRRFGAGLVNTMFIGLALLLASAVADHSTATSRLSQPARLYATGFVSLLWAIGIFKKKSAGAAVCLMEIRTSNGGLPRALPILLRTAPGFLVVLVGLIPDERLSAPGEIAHGLVWLGLFLVTAFSGLVAMTTRTSLLDRLSGTVMLQLELPDQMKPRLFGIRVI